MYAKLYNTVYHGQIVVMLVANPETKAPIMHVSACPPQCLPSTLVMELTDEPGDWDYALNQFRLISEANAIALAEPIFKNAAEQIAAIKAEVTITPEEVNDGPAE